MNGGNNLNNLKKFIRATNYLSVAQIFLQDNFLLERPLEFKDIKPRLLGHWGSCPGVNHIYAHLLLSQSKLVYANSNLSTAFMLGPGHAFPALQANLFMESTLNKYDNKASLNKQGIAYICKNFSWPNGFPSHASPFTPSVILEGGELGYSLATAFGAVLDKPNLIMATVIGDGEAETGALASAWQLNKLVSPIKNGVVLPILHLNKYKISGPTIFGSMSDFELIQFFHGAGWNPKIVDEYTSEDFDLDMERVFEESYRDISRIKFKNSEEDFVRLPMIIVRSKKGSSGVKNNHGEKIEGNYLAHQVPLPKAGQDEYELRQLEDWLKSYKFNELFSSRSNLFGNWLLEFLPNNKGKIGTNEDIYAGNNYKPLKLPKHNLEELIEKKEESLAMNSIGNYLAKVFEENKDDFRFFSPDETYSNKLDAIFSKEARMWQRKINSWEKDLEKNGRVSEILSEHCLQGMLQGYLLTGRHGVLTSYEAFAPIIGSMMNQYAKFLAQSKEVSWRGNLASLNYILTSTGWRQDHNGFSHQNPGFIDDVLRRGNSIGQVFLPSDDISALVCIDYMLKTKNNINVLVAGKTPEPRFLSCDQIVNSLANGGITVYDLWRKTYLDWLHDNHNEEPDVILVASGDYMHREVIASSQILQNDLPNLKIRIVNIPILNSNGIGSIEKTITIEEFKKIFGDNIPAVYVFHGYPKTIKSVLFDYWNPARFDVLGYQEKGSTTTPFDMLARNGVSRFDIAERVLCKIKNSNSDKLIEKYRTRTEETINYAREHGVDPENINDNIIFSEI